jgi:hypothetical protein
MVNCRKLYSSGRGPLASILSIAFIIEVIELCANLLTFDAEESEHPLMVRFAGCHKYTH